ncbi:hypothetical protein F442_05412 [Phytophthora nicotianae P10297]|uniref:Uncharacterized protein n=2 Tax=Phytophthora nicotianae TaxID=4792 RepID=W2ZNG7_PHYNI|nr:hypothetical protein L916_05178 [Phytophthora nicotianae]ETL97702.1 hypothetical protein L917_05063 [Phytophthora nicotianae]ETP48947.1 hypothetical protein F442_05412 [Phytophthora nicotianae P10297]
MNQIKEDNFGRNSPSDDTIQCTAYISHESHPPPAPDLDNEGFITELDAKSYCYTGATVWISVLFWSMYQSMYAASACTTLSAQTTSAVTNNAPVVVYLRILVSSAKSVGSG